MDNMVKELAERLNGREYGEEMTEQEEHVARENGIVVVYGYSDNMEFRGFIDDEVGCYDGGDAFVGKGGLLVNKCDNEDCPYFRKEQEAARKITAVWGGNGFSWYYRTEIPHETFVIMEDGETYCLGIVFSINNV